jgi:hypothetical protein
MENMMAIEALAIRAEAADRRESARDAAHLYAMTRQHRTACRRAGLTLRGRLQRLVRR